MQVTIGMPVYNGARTIGAALDSLVTQSYRDTSVVISDNASTDETEEICRKYAEYDSRIRYIRQAVPLSAAMNFRAVLCEARTPFFMWAAADDLWAASFIERHIAFLMSNPDYVCSQSRVLFAKNRFPLNLSTGTYPLDGTVEENIAQYFKNPGDNSRYYGLYRTHVLQAVFPIRNFYGLDWAVSASTVKYGKHNELPEVLMVRDRSDPVIYANAVTRDHRRLIWRIFPLFYMTLHMFRNQRMPQTLPIIAALICANLYIPFRFSVYRWSSLVERYIETSSLRQSAKYIAISSLRNITQPGLGSRLQYLRARLCARLTDALRPTHRLMPNPFESRHAIKSWPHRVVPSIVRRFTFHRGLQAVVGVTNGSEHAATSATIDFCGVQVLRQSWRSLPKPTGKAPRVSVIIVVQENVLATLTLIDALARYPQGTNFEVVLVDNFSSDVTSIVFSCREDLTYIRSPSRQSFTDAAAAGVKKADGDVYVFIDQFSIVGEGFLAHILEGLDRAAMVAPHIQLPDGRIKALGAQFSHNLESGIYLHQLEKFDHSKMSAAKPTDYCPDAFAVTRDEYWKAAGSIAAFETLEVMGAELAMRVRAEKGQVVTSPGAILTNYRPSSDQSSKSADWLMFAARNGCLR